MFITQERTRTARSPPGLGMRGCPLDALGAIFIILSLTISRVRWLIVSGPLFISWSFSASLRSLW